MVGQIERKRERDNRQMMDGWADEWLERDDR